MWVGTFAYFLKQNEEGWMNRVNVTNYSLKAVRNPSFPKTPSTAGREVPRWQVSCRVFTGNETGKLHFAQLHIFSTDPNYYFRTSRIIWWGGSVG